MASFICIVHTLIGVSLCLCFSLIPATTFYPDNTQRNWTDGASHCLSLGYQMVTIHNEQKYNEVNTFISEHSAFDKIWLGIHLPKNSENSDDFRWVDDYPLTWANWAEDHPKNLEFKKCVFLNGMQGSTYRSKECSSEFVIACEENNSLSHTAAVLESLTTVAVLQPDSSTTISADVYTLYTSDKAVLHTESSTTSLSNPDQSTKTLIDATMTGINSDTPKVWPTTTSDRQTSEGVWDTDSTVISDFVMVSSTVAFNRKEVAFSRCNSTKDASLTNIGSFLNVLPTASSVSKRRLEINCARHCSMQNQCAGFSLRNSYCLLFGDNPCKP